MMLGVLTTAARPWRYPLTLLAEIDRQGWPGPKVMLCDGDPAEEIVARVRPDWRLLAMPKSSPNNSAAYHELLVQAAREGRDALLLEDDVDLAEGGLGHIRRAGIPAGLDALAWFETIFRPGVRAGIYRAPASAFAFCQAVSYPLSTVRRLVHAEWPLGAGADAVVASILGSDSTVGYHVPALVQHEGQTSVAHPERADFPRSYTFVRDARYLQNKGDCSCDC